VSDLIQQPTCVVRQLGLRDYEPVWRRMQAFNQLRTADTRDEIWLVQHFPVFTQGQAGKDEHLLSTGSIPVIRVDRGGQVTYHGPGQLVAYLLLDIKRRPLGPRPVVDAIERSVMDVLASWGIDARARPKAPGVYVDDAKIAALGLRFKNGSSYHGLSFNIDMDLKPFALINPCGFQGLKTTQLKDHLSEPPADLMQQAEQRMVQELARHLHYNAIEFCNAEA
jgi:lipoyl(octanoyl) transferase